MMNIYNILGKKKKQPKVGLTKMKFSGLVKTK